MEMVNWTILATIFVEHLFYIILMVVLLGCSAFFSGSETAFFHLSQRTVRQFAQSAKRAFKSQPVSDRPAIR
jgi:Mg2+/Co2+ transporter CorB